MSNAAAGRRAAVNGLQMDHEIHGIDRDAQPPIVLLHGAMSNLDTDFGKLLPALAQSRRVIALEQQGHGRTADVDQPLSYERMADNTAELLRQLQVVNADFVCYSMGGGIALELAMRCPGLVRKIVYIGGAAFDPQGFHPELREAETAMTAEDLAGTPWQQAYARLAPNPDAWPALVAKSRDLDLTWRGWTPDQLRPVKAPTLIINGDADIVRPEHVVEMFQLLGGGVAGDLRGLPRAQLAILPGTTHVTVIERTDWLLSMIMPFLDAPMPPPE